MKCRLAIVFAISLCYLPAGAEGPRFESSKCRIDDLVGDITAGPDSLCERFEVVRRRRAFLRYEGTEGRASKFNVNGYEWIQNPLLLEFGGDSDASRVDLLIEIETSTTARTMRT